MVCPSCGKEVADSDAVCSHCQSLLTHSGSGLPASPEPVPESPRRSGKALASFALGLLSLVFWVGLLACVGGNHPKVLVRGLLVGAVLAGLVSVIYGHRAKALIRQSTGRLTGKGMATAGLVIGYLSLALMLFLIAAAALLNLFVQNSRMAANESSAVGSLARINTAATIYAEANGGYPPSLAALGPANPKVCVESSGKITCLLDADLAAGIKSNYRFTYVPGPADRNGIVGTYAVRADPSELGVSGRIDYYTDQTGVIRFEKGKAANQNSPPVAK